MQALGGYQGGRMLFLGIGTGLGSAMIFDGVVIPLELAHLPYKNGRTYEEYIGLAGLERRGKVRWRKSVLDVVARLSAALLSDYVILGGGNAKLMKDLPKGVIIGANSNAIAGGLRLWQDNSGLSALPQSLTSTPKEKANQATSPAIPKPKPKHRKSK
jgi:polyphosphate glucokinase